jgi:hypothetical protein
MINNAIAKMALGQLINFMKRENISQLKVFINEKNEVDFEPVKEPDELILKSYHDLKIKELKEYLKTIKK